MRDAARRLVRPWALVVGSMFVSAAGAGAQSAADLSWRLRIDGRSDDFTAVEAVFRNADVCPSILPPDSCMSDEERDGDSVASHLQDVQQIRVTWDAVHLYVAADARVSGAALVLWLDYRPGGLAETNSLPHWRRAVRFGAGLRPDAFLAVRDAAATPDLFLVDGEEALTRVDPERYRARATFDAGAAGRSLEAAIPWEILFPGAPALPNPEAGAPAFPMFVLPEASSRMGLRLAAAVVDANEGFGALDLAPDNAAGLPIDPRQAVDVDRFASVAWDENAAGTPHFVDFGAAVQTQESARFSGVAADAPPLRVGNLQTFAAGRASRLVLADAGLDLAFTFEVETPAPDRVFVSASIFSMRGERVVDLYRDVPRTPVPQAPPFGVFGRTAQDRWDGRDAAGAPVPGGIYLLRLSAGTSAGTPAAQEQRAISVVR